MSPRTREQNEEIRNQRKQEILQAAMRVYVEKGYAASEVSDIADQAGLAHGLVFYYFKNKKNLFRELYEYVMEETRSSTEAFFEQESPVIELFCSYARMVCERVLENPVLSQFYMRISLDIHFLYTPDEMSPMEWVKSFMAPMRQTIERGIREGSVREGNSHLMAMQFWGSVSQGMAYLNQTQNELEAQGLPKTEVDHQLISIMDQVVDSSVSILKR